MILWVQLLNFVVSERKPNWAHPSVTGTAPLFLTIEELHLHWEVLLNMM
jgi:hypothetical protein